MPMTRRTLLVAAAAGVVARPIASLAAVCETVGKIDYRTRCFLDVFEILFEDNKTFEAVFAGKHHVAGTCGRCYVHERLPRIKPLVDWYFREIAPPRFERF